MKNFIICCLLWSSFHGCQKERTSSVAIYLLDEFTLAPDSTTFPATLAISDYRLAPTPLVKDTDIRYYNKSTSTFFLKNTIHPLIRHYGPKQAFAVTVNQQPVYFGLFHPGYLSSKLFGLATIDPILAGDPVLAIEFSHIDGHSFLQQKDRRNDPLLINDLKAAGKLR